VYLDFSRRKVASSYGWEYIEKLYWKIETSKTTQNADSASSNRIKMIILSHILSLTDAILLCQSNMLYYVVCLNVEEHTILSYYTIMHDLQWAVAIVDETIREIDQS